jgi:hypothetical protein
MSKSRLVSGKVKKASPSSADANRYDFLDLSNAEPDLGVADDAGYILVSDTEGVRQWVDPFDIPGFVGSQGDVGFTGSQGDIGYTGSRGDIGYTGSKGDTGMGFIIAKIYESVAELEADTEPTGIIAGQFAIIETGDVEDLENSQLYLWDGTQYIYITDLSGAQGIRGFAGSQGDIGYTGSQGDIGFTGSQGDTGFVGSQGDIGYTGSQGDIGYTGSQGDIGFTGSQGDTGFVGSQGDIGYTGSQGDTGFVGSQGDLGYTGSAGLGFTGSQGDAGFTGSQGTPGEAAAIGYTGSQGPIGYTGSAGSGGGGGGGEATPVTVDTASQAIETDNRYILIYDGTVELTLPTTPSFGATFYILIANNRITNIIRRNGHKIMGLEEDLTLDVETASFGLIYVDSTLGWRIL